VKFLKSVQVAFFAFALMVVAAVPSYAVDPTIDYTTIVGGAKTELLNSLVGSAPLIFGILGTMVGIGLVMKWLKRAAKSS
jgi:hypothetical protein